MVYAVVTGASKGIGKAIATQLARRGYNLVLVARSEKLLSEFSVLLEKEHNVQVKYLAVDLSNPDSAINVAGWIKKENLPVTLLVNNAGYGLWGRFNDLNLNQQLSMLRLNNESLLALTYSLLPLLLEQKGRTYILNIASTTAYQPIPYMSAYAASKAFVVSFSRALAHELKATNVSVTCVSPGATETEFMKYAGMNSPRLIDSANKVSMNANDVAKQAIEALLNKRIEFVPGIINKITALAGVLLPKTFLEKTAANIYNPN